MTRAEAIQAFLAAAGLGGAERRPLAGDASARRYERVGGLVLMDAGPDGEVGRFLLVGARLAEAGLSVPRVHAADEATGLVLMEDLGDRLLAGETTDLPKRYAKAADAVHRLGGVPTDGLLDHASAMAGNVDVVHDWYAPERWDARGDLRAAVEGALAALPPGRALIHRDYHAENLLVLPGRTGTARTGILDFQDAGSGPLDYDLASLTRDVRRDVAPAAARAATARLAALSGRGEADVARGSAICAAQRNLRILGVFARLARCYGKQGYLRWLPRAWALLQGDLRHPALEELRAVVAATVPAPTPERLAALATREPVAS